MSSDFQVAFDALQCLEHPSTASVPHRWVLELHSWTSHRLVTGIAAILLREYIGYSVLFNQVSSPWRLHERLQKVGVDVMDSQGDRPSASKFGYADMEVWPLRVQPTRSESFVDAGPTGYDGDSGWWIAKSENYSSYSLPPDFFRAYNVSHPLNKPLLEALKMISNVSCESACCPCSEPSCQVCGAATGCNAEGDVQWCPGKSAETLPAIIAMIPSPDEGFNEELSRSNGFHFGIHFMRQEVYMKRALTVLSTRLPSIVQMSRPSLLFTRVQKAEIPILRLMLPRDHCGSHRADGTGNWSCDLPTQQLRKLVSVDVEKDAVATDFFRNFRIPRGQLDEGIDELLGDLPPSATDEEILRVACNWVQAHKALWQKWATPREVPFFADTLHSTYPFPILALLLIISAVWMALLENPWLSTTLSIREWRKILQKNNAVWRSDVELKLRKNIGDSPCSSPIRKPSGIQDAFWEGLAEKSERAWQFWEKVNAWAETKFCLPEDNVSEGSEGVSLVSFIHHTFPCFQHSKEAILFLHRTKPAEELLVEVVIEENSGGGKSGRDFMATTHQVTFRRGQDQVSLAILIVDHKECWQNTYWFQARIVSLKGPGQLAEPARATILVLDEDTWPNNIPSSVRTGTGVYLLKYFIQADRRRRGRKWTKTMIAMVFLPVHSVLVSTLVQKVLVDHAVGRMIGTDSEPWGYFECLILVIIQLLSLGLNRWADVVQTRNRGRTGGIRQVHRSEMIRKFMHLERSEYWEASDADWLYSAIYDVDVITNKAYFGVFVMAQSCFALLLSVLLVGGLAAWSYVEEASSVGVQTAWYVLGVFVMMAAGIVGVWIRMKVIWVAVLARKKRECAWFKSCIFVFTSWRQFMGLMQTEKAKLEQGVLAQNDVFVPSHWDARDTMNDTAWITHWIQGVSYCLMLTFGSFALADYNTYGVGVFEVGTFYALCKIYLSVGKYIGRLSKVFVDMQQAVVSLRDVAAMLNQTCQKSKRAEATRLLQFGKGRWRDQDGMVNGCIHFQDDLCFVRPEYYKVGSTFSDLRLHTGCLLPLGRCVMVCGRNERVLRSFLGLASQAIYPTGPNGEDMSEEWPSVLVPPGLTLKMLSTLPVAFGSTGPSTIQQLSFTGASSVLCEALVAAVGLDKDRDPTSLGPGSSQVFSIVRALLVDPDVLCAFRPLSLVPLDIKPRMGLLLRLWQAGGLPKIADMLGVPVGVGNDVVRVYRPSTRTLILGNSHNDFPDSQASPSDFMVDLDEHLWQGPDSPMSESPRHAELQDEFQRRKLRSKESKVHGTPRCSCLGRSYPGLMRLT